MVSFVLFMQNLMRWGRLLPLLSRLFSQYKGEACMPKTTQTLLTTSAIHIPVDSSLSAVTAVTLG